MGISINTRRAHAARQLGDLTFIFTWVNDERAMVIVPTFRVGAPWYIVADSAAWKYDEPAYLARQAIKAAEVLGMQGQEVRIAGLIHDHLGDLVTMPSAPPQELSRARYGQLTLKADGMVIGGEEIRATVGEGASYG